MKHTIIRTVNCLSLCVHASIFFCLFVTGKKIIFGLVFPLKGQARGVILNKWQAQKTFIQNIYKKFIVNPIIFIRNDVALYFKLLFFYIKKRTFCDKCLICLATFNHAKVANTPPLTVAPDIIITSFGFFSTLIRFGKGIISNKIMANLAILSPRGTSSKNVRTTKLKGFLWYLHFNTYFSNLNSIFVGIIIDLYKRLSVKKNVFNRNKDSFSFSTAMPHRYTAREQFITLTKLRYLT